MPNCLKDKVQLLQSLLNRTELNSNYWLEMQTILSLSLNDRSFWYSLKWNAIRFVFVFVLANQTYTGQLRQVLYCCVPTADVWVAWFHPHLVSLFLIASVFNGVQIAKPDFAPVLAPRFDASSQSRDWGLGWQRKDGKRREGWEQACLTAQLTYFSPESQRVSEPTRGVSWLPNSLHSNQFGYNEVILFKGHKHWLANASPLFWCISGEYFL